MNKICAIHQPNFFPWMGYFDKIKNSDIFVFLDDVQNPKKGSSKYTNRVELNYFGKKKYYTCPIKKVSGLTPINKIEFSDLNWKSTFLNVVKNYYLKSKNFIDTYNFIKNLLDSNEDHLLSNFNKHIIQEISLKLGFETEFVLKSDLNIETKSTQMLIDVCKSVGANTYLCGGGASSYQDDELFKSEGINLEYQKYLPEPYGLAEDFLPGLSVIDYLMVS